MRLYFYILIAWLLPVVCPQAFAQSTVIYQDDFEGTVTGWSVNNTDPSPFPPALTESKLNLIFIDLTAGITTAHMGLTDFRSILTAHKFFLCLFQTLKLHAPEPPEMSNGHIHRSAPEKNWPSEQGNIGLINSTEFKLPLTIRVRH